MRIFTDDVANDSRTAFFYVVAFGVDEAVELVARTIARFGHRVVRSVLREGIATMVML